MQALVFDGTLQLRELPDPTPGPGEARVAVRMAGICNTDLEITRGYAADASGATAHARVLGHELLGVVDRCDNPAWLGRRVVGEINLGCGACERCDRGLAKHCATRRVMGIRDHAGCFAEYVVLPLANLHEVPPGVTDEAALFTEPLAAALQVLEQIDVPVGSEIAVIGDGKLGLLVAMALIEHGARVTVLGRHPHKLAIAGGLGCSIARGDELPAASFDRVVEATGGAEGFALAQRLLRPRGTLILKSTFHGETPVAMAPVVVDELTIVGSRCGPFGRALALLQRGRIDPRALLEARYDLDHAPAAMAHAARRGALKVALDLREGARGLAAP
jgi:alcohol dehydrogenase